MDQIAKTRREGVAPIGNQTMSSGLALARNYHRWTYDWIAPFVQGRILDVGGGTGNHLAFLSDQRIVSIDISRECIRDLQMRHAARPNWSFEVGDITDPGIVDRFGAQSFDTVLSCNVFEHIEHDERAFMNSAALLKPGGKLVLILPAHPSLYGSVDRLAGHYRRYSAAQARQRLEAGHLELFTLRYVNSVGAIGWFVNNRLVRHRALSSPTINGQIHAFDRYLVPLLMRLEGSRRMPFGQSLLCVGRKPAPGDAANAA
ncbi:MAG TPA: class I SAM-dependent methyltransferase [Burkholderiales bacterium]|nr:class I SAM-dependent methyltransferase [Burkholderiales bacterium]